MPSHASVSAIEGQRCHSCGETKLKFGFSMAKLDPVSLTLTLAPTPAPTPTPTLNSIPNPNLEPDPDPKPHPS